MFDWLTDFPWCTFAFCFLFIALGVSWILKARGNGGSKRGRR
jgi:hypothetical protein